MPSAGKKISLGPLGKANKGTVIGVSIGGVTLAGYLIYRERKKSAAAAAASAATAAASSSYGYGAVAGYGYGSAYMGYGYGVQNNYGYGASGGFEPTGYYGYGVTEPPVVQPVANTTNAQWAQAAITQLEQEGYDPQTVGAALGAYELGQPVSATQVTIIDNAIGIEGYPPVPGASGNPPGIVQQGTNGGGGGGGQGGGGSGNVTVPNVVGQRADAARPALRKAGLTYNIGDTATGTVTKQSPTGGKSVTKGSKVTLTLKK
jgi:PASTA domain